MRLGCCVPFCRRTTARAEFDEWICGKHWQMVSKDRRRAYGRRTRQWRRYYTVDDAVMARLWAALKREAIERAAGI
jgi:hypothetical protein